MEISDNPRKVTKNTNRDGQVQIEKPPLTLKLLLSSISLLFRFPIFLVFLYVIASFLRILGVPRREKLLLFRGFPCLFSLQKSKGWRVRALFESPPSGGPWLSLVHHRSRSQIASDQWSQPIADTLIASAITIAALIAQAGALSTFNNQKYPRGRPPGLLQHVLTVLPFWSCVLLLPRLPPWSRSLRLLPWASNLFYEPLAIAWIWCPQLPCHLCKNGMAAPILWAPGKMRSFCRKYPCPWNFSF